MKKLSGLLVLAALCAVMLPGSIRAQVRGQQPAAAPSTGGATPYLPGLVEVINPWSEAPMLKFRMGHEHKQLLMVDYCYGDIYVTASRVQFNVGGPYAVHSFDLPREQVTGVKPWSVGLEIVVNRKKYHVLLYPLDKGEP
ncbi:MAG: hypothetical protein ACRD4T_05585, partial [Candidatus Acidiferrales bacterium]